MTRNVVDNENRVFLNSNYYRVSGHNGQVFDGNFPSLGELCVKTEVM